ncbi:hypothetical protein K491DRAFT_699213 [Lophiostoma macrostomum CBS 122681]|uniref:AMP-activated protein kinase glycogen-binding domain-containing protein n=1 Tax=Lophiostoma macrostomum CBS 122681 TaxID=1314788 RepID=A0A6A6SKW3_9PLEO|nr:hypothetical protein K491DRAFT_699213 [Lophiostoma macrostomum CBS 122681]
MSGTATITFSAVGLQPPVYLVTSLSSPAWAILEMHPAGQTESGENLFSRTFDDIAIGSYQYKVRIGEDHWVVDERQETTTDQSGNKNNLIHVTEEAGNIESDNRAGDDDDNASDTVVNDSDDAASDSKEGHVEPGTPEEQAAPLLPHEQHSEEPPPAPLRRKSTEPLDIIEEESSTQGSSADSSHRPDDEDDDEGHDEEDDELDQGPRLDHELSTSGFDSSISENETLDEGLEDDVEDGTYELQEAPTFGYERMAGAESSIAPRFSYERTSEASSVHSSESPTGEDAPILPHENLNRGDDTFRAPLLPHEYPGGVPTPESSDGYSFGGGSLNEDGHEPFSYGVDFGTPAYPERRSSFLLRTRTNSGLPHALPRSDDEDPNLNDPSLQPFPTERKEILERVGTIKTKLPQDETIESPVNSPFVASQACSSVDLASAELGPVHSHISLNAVEEEDDDIGDLPSSTQESPAEEGAHALRMRQYGGCPGPVDRDGNPTTQGSIHPQQATDPNERAVIQDSDGAHDGPRAWSDLYESVATPTRVLTSFMTPINPADWVRDIPSDADSAVPRSDDTNRTRLAAQDSSDSMAIRPIPSQTTKNDPFINERMEHKAFEVNRSYPYMGEDRPPRTVTQKIIDDVIAGFDWVCGCCGSCGPQARTAQGM